MRRKYGGRRAGTKRSTGTGRGARRLPYAVPQRIPDPALSAAPAALLCMSTAPDRATADRIARALVDERLPRA